MISAARLAPAALAALALSSTALAQPQSPPQAPAADDALIGLWASETTFPSPQGELTLARKGAAWRATLSGAEANFAAAGDAVRFQFSGGGGFRGAVSDHGKTIRGFWLRPSGGTADRRDPGGSGQAFASPLLLRAAGPGRWRGTVRPLRDSFTLYAKIYRDADGKLVGAIRNPEINSNGGATLYQVSREGDAVRFSARADPASPEILVKASLVHSPDRLRVVWPDLGATLDLTRRTPAEAQAFFPRPPGKAAYAYRKPPATGDGWDTARARDVGMDEAVLEKLVRRLTAADPALRRPPLIHSLLVAHKGKLVLEEYFYGYGRDTPHDTRSAGKTFASVMLGAAMMDGAPLSPESRITDVMAGMGPFANPDPRKDRITLAQLMTHSAGLACNDYDDASPGNEGTMQSQTGQPNWWKYTLDLPMAHDPGTRYAYCSANINLVGGALTVATHTWLPELFDRTVAEPLQFGPWYWDLAADGEGYQGGGAFVRPRDLLKIGQAYVDGGVWRGRRIVPADWVRLSTAAHMEITPATTGLSAEEFPNDYFPGQDGYAWHLGTIRVGERTYPDYAATGNGGQLLIVVPDFDLVVVFTAGNYMQGGIWSRFRTEIVPREIVPAIRQ